MSVSSFQITQVTNVRSQQLFASDFYEVKDWQFDFASQSEASKGYNDCLCVVFVRKGNFNFDLSAQTYDLYSGCVIIDKPDYEYRLRPATGSCTIFNFTKEFYERIIEDYNLKHSFFFCNANILSLMLRASAECEYLHHRVMKKAAYAGKLEMDNLTLELFRNVLSAITDAPFDFDLNDLRTFHLNTVEAAKEFLIENFHRDVSLRELADHCCVSPFHFARLFKKYTSLSPHQFLMNVRLKHGEMMLKGSTAPVSEVAFQSGFNSIEYFATAFRHKYGLNPTLYRAQTRS